MVLCRSLELLLNELTRAHLTKKRKIIMPDYYTVQTLSKLTGITKVTLRYYDKAGLFKPTYKSHANYRRYTKADLGVLQQITTLRFLGFSVEQMKQILSDASLNIKQSLRVQEMIMYEKAKRLTEAAKLIGSLIDSLDQNDLIDWKIQSKIIEVLQLQDTSKNTWYKTFLTPAEAKAFETLSDQRTPEYWGNYQARWAALFKDIEGKLYTDPESETGLQFAERWFALVNEVYKNNRPLGDKLWEGYKAGVISDSPLPYKPEVIEYMAKAKKKYLESVHE